MSQTLPKDQLCESSFAGPDVALLIQALLGTESPSKRTRLSAKGSPSKGSAAIEAKRAAQLDDLDHDVKQVMNYADEKVVQLGLLS